MADLEIHRASYGSLRLPGADAVAVEFFTDDISSNDPGHASFDERAISHVELRYDETDTTAIRRGMRLNRLPRGLWPWVRDEAPAHLLAALPPGLDLIDSSDAEIDAAWDDLSAALAGFIAPAAGARRRLAVATKIMHLKRPRLVPILDRNVLSVLGLHLADDASHAKQIEMGLTAAALIRREGRRNREPLAVVEESLRAADLERSPNRILDGLLWLAY